jgi:hypothetical protein
VSSSATRERPPAVQPAAPATVPSPPPTAAPQQSIQLSAGVALAQTGPDGTMMMFSVDYEFAQGEASSSGYVWVIERARGNPAKVEVRLKAKDTLTTAIGTGWRPEDGPFHSHLEDSKGNRVSESIEMQQPGT